MTIDEIRGRVSSVCASQPFGFAQAKTPFSFDLQPSGEIDEVFRIETEGLQVIGGFNYLEDRTDAVHIWIARKYEADPEATYQRLLRDMNSIRAAVIHDACEFSGEYSIPDEGAGMTLQRESGKAFAVCRLTMPANYEVFT